MGCVDERMQRRVDRRNRAALAELAVGVHVDDVVLVDPARMNPFERQDEIEIEQRQPPYVNVPRSPPEPLTASTRRSSPVIGSGNVSLADVLPPA